MKGPVRLAAAAALLAFLPLRIEAVPFSTVTVFGDSTVDPGNAQAAALGLGLADPAPAALGYFNGRFTNGLTYADRLNIEFGSGSAFAPAITVVSGTVVPVPGQTNFAVGGAEALAENPLDPIEGGSSLAAQLALYQTVTGGVADPNALYLFNIGGNDVRESLDDALAAGSVAGETADIQDTVNAILGSISVLSAAGADQFLVANVSNVGLFPERGGDPLAIMLGDQLSSLFNTTLQAGLAGLGSGLGLDISVLDLAALQDDVFSNMLLADLVQPCVVPGVPAVCPDPEERLFYDPIHLTAAAQQIVFDRAAASLVPVPASAAFLLLGLAAVRRARR